MSETETPKHAFVRKMCFDGQDARVEQVCKHCGTRVFFKDSVSCARKEPKDADRVG